MGQTVRADKVHMKKQFWLSNVGSEVKSFGEEQELQTNVSLI